MAQQPMMTQPQPGWMTHPAAVPDCPPGLEYLSMLDQLLCHQVVEMIEAFTGWQTNNRFAIKNNLGQQAYYAFEETDMCMRQCCGPNREFTVHIVDNFNKEVMRIYRPLVLCGATPCCAGTCSACTGEIFVEAPPGHLIGKMTQTQSLCTMDFEIKDAQDNTQLLIKGPCLMCRCCNDVEFPVLSRDGVHTVGLITKQWSGMGRELFTSADNFGITFPMDLDVKMKGTLIGAMFLIDFAAFERQS